MRVVKLISNMFQIPAGEHVNQVNQVRCAKGFGNGLRLLVTVLWTGRKRVSLAARGAMFFFVGSICWVNPCPSAAAAWAVRWRCGQDENRLVGMEAADVVCMFSF